MKIESILAIEERGENRMNLVWDSLFWQAGNKNVFLFATHIKDDYFHKRFIYKTSQNWGWVKK